MHLDMGIIHLASYVANILTRKLQYHAFFCSTLLHRDVQPLPVKGNASVPKASEMTFLRQLLAHDILKKSWMTFLISIKLHRDVQPLPVKGNASVPKASEMTFLRQLLAHDILKKSWMAFSVSNK